MGRFLQTLCAKKKRACERYSEPSLPVSIGICKTVYPYISITIEYTCSVNKAKPKWVSPNNSEINSSYYSDKQAWRYTTNLQYTAFIKKMPFNFTYIYVAYNCELNAKFLSFSQNPIHQKTFLILFSSKSQMQMLIKLIPPDIALIKKECIEKCGWMCLSNLISW